MLRGAHSRHSGGVWGSRVFPAQAVGRSLWPPLPLPPSLPAASRLSSFLPVDWYHLACLECLPVCSGVKLEATVVSCDLVYDKHKCLLNARLALEQRSLKLSPHLSEECLPENNKVGAVVWMCVSPKIQPLCQSSKPRPCVWKCSCEEGRKEGKSNT